MASPNSVRLEDSKKVLLVHVPQGAAKSGVVKFVVLEKIKSVHRWHCFHMKIWGKTLKSFFSKILPWNISTVIFLEPLGSLFLGSEAGFSC